MKKTVLVVSLAGLMMSCSDGDNVPSYLGDYHTRGYCGYANKPFQNPISNDINPEEFEEVASLEAGDYKATHVAIYYRESATDLESPQVMAIQGDVFVGKDFVTRTFVKSCGRGFERSSEGQAEVVLPVKLKLNTDKTWSTVQAAKYSIVYGPELSTGLDLTAKLDDSASPSSDARDYVSSTIISPVKKDKGVVVIKTYEEFRDDYIKNYFLSSFVRTENLDVTKQYNAYVKKRERLLEKVEFQNSQPKEIFLQLEVQAEPKIYARVKINKYDPKAEEEAAAAAEEKETH